MSESFRIQTPSSVEADPEALELLRMWWSKNEPVMAVMPAFKDPRQFGAMLAYAARHMAHAYAVRHNHFEQDAYGQILQGFSDTLAGPQTASVVEKTEEAK